MVDGNDYILETKNLTKKFGDLVAVDHVNLKVKRGIIHAIIGPNGAGKTTLFNLISGVLKPTEGRIFFEGRDITDLPPHKRADLGIGRSFQIPTLFSNLTVLENIRLAIQAKYKNISKKIFSDATKYTDLMRDALRVLAIVGMYGKTSIIVKSLPLSEKRKLEIALAIARDPKLVLLDEPTAGISIEEIPMITQVIKRIKSPNRTVIVVEHKMNVILDIADWITVMDKGKIIAEGTPKEIMENEKVQEVYLGEI